MTSSFPTSGWAVIGALLFLISTGAAWWGRTTWKLVKDLRDENKELQEQVIKQVIPAVQESTATLRQALQQLAASDALARERRPR